MTVINITPFFDFICAWSYIGHRTLFQTIEIFQKTHPGASADRLNIHFRPFYRDRALPEQGVPLEERLVSAFGEEHTEDVLKRVQKIGLQHGIVFQFKSKIGSTRKAHQLLHHIGEESGAESQRVFLEHVYHGWNELQNDITSDDFLIGSATAIGIYESSAREVLTEGRYASDIDMHDAKARENAIKAVPTFEKDGKIIEGAADVQSFYEAFVEAKEKSSALV